jgi:threonine dehydrogenase-like Zn-dependent dehydrogenase
VLERTAGRGAQAVIEAVGADQTINDALLCAGPGGTVSVIGVSMNLAFPFPIPVALMRRLTFRVTLASVPVTWEALVPLVASGRLQPEDVFTHRLGLSEASDAYRTFDNREDGVLKVVLDPTT